MFFVNMLDNPLADHKLPLRHTSRWKVPGPEPRVVPSALRQQTKLSRGRNRSCDPAVLMFAFRQRFHAFVTNPQHAANK